MKSYKEGREHKGNGYACRSDGELALVVEIVNANHILIFLLDWFCVPIGSAY